MSAERFSVGACWALALILLAAVTAFAASRNQRHYLPMVMVEAGTPFLSPIPTPTQWASPLPTPTQAAPLPTSTPAPSTNRPPIAVDDVIVIPMDSDPKHLDVLANDFDLDGDQVLIASVTDAVYGSVTAAVDRRWVVYMPAPGFEGVDGFAYGVTDGTDVDDAIVIVVVVGPNRSYLPLVNIQ